MTEDGQVKGFTLLELLLCIAIISLLFSAGAGLSDLVERERRFQAIIDLRRTVNYARGQAVAGGMQVTVCALDQARNCKRDWSGSDYAVFIDNNRNQRLDESEALRMGHWSEARGSLIWRAALKRRYLRFRALGDTAQNGSFWYCPPGATRTTRIVLNRGGRNYVDDSEEEFC